MDMRLIQALKLGMLVFTCFVIGYSLRNLYVTEGQLRTHLIHYPAGIKWASWSSSASPDGAAGDGAASQANGDAAAEAMTGLEESESAEMHWASNQTGSLPFIWESGLTEESDESAELVRPSAANKATIGKATIAFESIDATHQRVLQTHERQNQLHGYPLHVLRTGRDEDLSWSTPAYLLSLLLAEMEKHPTDRLQWLLWFESNAVVMNPQIPLETFLPPTEYADIHLLLKNTTDGVDAGVFALRVNRWSIELMSTTFTYDIFRSTRTPNGDEADAASFEQVLKEILREKNYRSHTSRLPDGWFGRCEDVASASVNTTGELRQGEMMLHCRQAGGNQAQVEAMVELADQHLASWELPLNQTSYPEEAREFWKHKLQFDQEVTQKWKNLTETAEQMTEEVGKQMARFSKALGESERSRIEQKIARLKELQKDKEEDSERFEEVLRELSEAKRPLERLMEEEKEKVHQQAHAIMFNVEKAMAEADGEAQDPGELERIEDLVGSLRAILMEKPDEDETIQKSTDELVKISAGLMNRLREGKADEGARESIAVTPTEELSTLFIPTEAKRALATGVGVAAAS